MHVFVVCCPQQHMLGGATIAGITVPAMDQQHMMHVVC